MAQPGQPANDLEVRWRLAAAADLRLQAQLAAAVAADQRALVFAGFLVAASAALGGAAATVLTGSSLDHYLGKVAFVAACGMLAAMACALVAARPARWYFAGAQPSDWRNDLIAKKPEITQVEELLVDMDRRLRKNDRSMKVNGWWITSSASIALLTLFVAGILLAKHIWN